jgi:hypothetical protein
MVLALLLAAGTPARAQERVQYQGGPLELKPAAGLVAEEQTVTVTRERVKVSWLLRNTTDRALEVEAFFPISIPLTGSEEESDESVPLTKEWQPAPRWARSTSFQLAVDGQAHPFGTRARATDAGAEIVHTWRLKVPAAGTVRIEHGHFPGGAAAGPEGPADDQWQALQKDYCVGPKLIQAMRGRAGVTRVAHRLKGGAGLGTVRQFRLVLEKKGPGQRISLCMDGLVKKSATTFELTARDFTPRDDLRLVFLDEVRCVDPTTRRPRPCP